MALIRYWREGWYHASLVKQGRKWATVRDLYKSARIKDGERVMEYRKRKVKLIDTKEPLWTK